MRAIIQSSSVKVEFRDEWRDDCLVTIMPDSLFTNTFQIKITELIAVCKRIQAERRIDEKDNHI